MAKRDSMQVVACAGGGRTRLEARPRPVPGPGEMRLRLRCAGLCGTDLFKLQEDSVPAGTVLGHELVGVVDALGSEQEDVTRRFEVGERVVVPHHVACGKCALCRRGSETLCAVFRENLLEPGGFSDYVLVRERAVRLAARKVPAGLADEAAVFLEPAACVLRAIRKAALTSDDESYAVVLGAGSMGLLFVLLLRALYPALKIVACDRVDERLRLAERLGASAASQPGPEGAGRAVRDLTAGLGADAVFDTAGGAAVLDGALALSREGGTVVLFAHAPAGEKARFDLNHLFKLERRVVGTYSSSLDDQNAVYQLLLSGRFDPSPLVTHRLPLAAFDEAVHLARSRRALKVLLEPEVGAS